jgi:hypothetical protein
MSGMLAIQSGASTPIPWFVAVPAFILFWCFVIWMISWMSGWQKLSRHFALKPSLLYGKKIHFFNTSGRFKQAGYNNVLKLAAIDRGLILKMNILFRLGHDPLLIPWDAISEISAVPLPIQLPGWLKLPVKLDPCLYELKLAKFPDVNIRLHKRAFDESGAMDYFQKSRG